MNEQMGIYSTVSIDYILAGVKSDLSLEDTNSYDLFLKDAINLGNKELKSLGNLVQCVTQLEIIDFKAQLPVGFYQFTKNNPIIYVNAQGDAISGVPDGNATVVAVDANGNNIGTSTSSFAYPYYRMFAPTFINNGFFKDSPFDREVGRIGTVNVVDGWLYFSSDITADYVKIAYIGSRLDEEGNLVYPDFAERALRAFAAYRFCRKMYTTHGAIMNDFKTEWMRGKASVKALAAMPDSTQYAFINRKMKSLI
jgi:hypothetical protein